MHDYMYCKSNDITLRSIYKIKIWMIRLSSFNDIDQNIKAHFEMDFKCNHLL